MKNISTIMRRELAAYFNSPAGFVYLIAFVLFTNLLGLFSVYRFFSNPVADMRPYFHVLAGVSTVLVAAISMRLWSEERKENTLEMLLTFPMKASELVLGKFFASLSFYALALLGTLTVPLMMILLSQPDASAIEASAGVWGMLDPGPLFSGYFGVFLTGALFISFGLFVSSFCKDQMMAFVLTAPILFFVYILGLIPVKTALDSALAFLGDDWGAWLGDFVGVFTHLDNLTRGVVDGVDILFFIVWTAVFLILNGIGVERRGRKGADLMYAISAVLLVAIGITSNWIIFGESMGRIDVTEEQVHTVSPVSAKVLGGLEKDVLNVTYYTSRRNKMPAVYQNLARDVRDRLESLRLASGGKLRYKVIELEAANALADPMAQKKEDEESSIEKRLLKKVQPFTVQVYEGDKVANQLIYSSIEITYKDKDSEVIPEIKPENLPMLEYDIVNKIYRSTRERKPVVALVAPQEALSPQLMAIYRQMGRPVPPPQDPYQHLQYLLDKQENYEVKRVMLDKNSPMPEEYDILVVVGPKRLNERQRYEINYALASGRPVFMAVQNYEWNFQRGKRGGLSVSRAKNDPGVNPLLTPNGVSVEDKSLMDSEEAPLNVQIPLMGMSVMQPLAMPIHSELKAGAFNDGSPITKKIDSMYYVWGSPLRLDEEVLKKNGLKATVLVQSNTGSWARETGDNLVQEDIEAPANLDTIKPMPLAVMLEGQFKDLYEGKERPEWPPVQADPRRPQPPSPKEGPQVPVTPKEGKLILIGAAKEFDRSYIRWPEWNFFRGCVDYMALDDTGRSIMELRNKTMSLRLIGNISDTSATVWKIVHIVLVNFVIAAVGIVMWLLRRSRRQAYNASN